MGIMTLSKLKQMYRRISAVVYSRPRLGKTTMLKEILKEGDLLFVMFYDRGLPDLLTWEEIKEWDVDTLLRATSDKSILDVRKNLTWFDKKIKECIEKGVEPWRIWFAIDTVTHLEKEFLTECRTIQLKGAGTDLVVSEDLQRDANVQFDYNVVQSWMQEVVSRSMALPCNVIFFALEKYDKEEKLYMPQLTGQNVSKVSGDVQLVARMIHHGKTGSKRVLICRSQPNCIAGARGGRTVLNENEPPSLIRIRNKLLGINVGVSDGSTSQVGEKVE